MGFMGFRLISPCRYSGGPKIRPEMDKISPRLLGDFPLTKKMPPR